MADFSTWFFISSGLFLGWSLGANHAVNVFGTAVVSKMVKFRTAAIIAGVFVVLGASISGTGTTRTINELGPINAIAGSFSVALAVGLSVTAMTRAKLPVSTSQAVVGGIIGWNMFTGTPTDLHALGRILLSWVASPVIAGLFGYGLFILLKRTVLTWRIHLLELDQYTRAGLIVVGALASYSLGANNIANVMGMFASAPLFPDIVVAGVVPVSGVQQLFLLGGIAIAVGVFTYGRRVMDAVGNDLYKISPLTGFVVVLAEFIVLSLFTSETIEGILLRLDLPTIPLVPLSTTQAFIGAILGVGLAKDPHSINFRVFGKIALGWVIAPLSAGLITFISLFFIQNVFEQRVITPVPYELSRSVITALKEEGIPADSLRPIIGTRYTNSRVFRNELMRRGNYSNTQIYTIFRYAIIDSFRIDTAALKAAGMFAELDSARTASVYALHGKSFRHKVDLDRALYRQDSSWAHTGNKLADKMTDKTRFRLETLLRVVPKR